MEEGLQRSIQIFIESFMPILVSGLKFTIPIAVISFVFGTALALVVALARLSSIKPLKWIAQFFVWIIRGTPLLVQLFILFYGLPEIGILIDPVPAAILGFTLNVGAYSSEIFRAAILSINKGQWEAAYSIGMTKGQAMKRIILPQSIRLTIPTLGNSFISLVKDTSLAAVITVPEMFQTSQQIAAVYYEPLLLYVEVAIIYLMFCSVLSIFQSKLEKKYEKFRT